MCESLTVVLLFVTAIPTVVFLVAHETTINAVAIVTAEFGWHFTCNVP